MRYLSTRGHADRKQFCEILLEGLASDGGLYLPESYPQMDASALSRLRQVWQDQGYAALAFEVLSLYIDDIPRDDLLALCRKPTRLKCSARKKSFRSSPCRPWVKPSPTCS